MHGCRNFRHKTLSEASTVSDMMKGAGTLQHDSPGSSLASSTALSSTPCVSHATISPRAGNSRAKLRLCDALYLLPTRLVALVLVAVQGGLLDGYLVHYNNRYWFAWIAGDIAVVFMFVVTFCISYGQMRDAMRCMQSGANHLGGGRDTVACCMGGVLGRMEDKCEEGLVGKEGPPSPGKMPLTYFAWLVYAAFLSIRVLLIYKNFAHTLQADTFLGPNTLQMTVAASGVVFAVFLFAHHDASPDSRRRQRIDLLAGAVFLDVADATDLLSVFLNAAARDSMQEWLEWAVMGVACLNFVLPTLLLMMLSKTHFGARRLTKHLQALHRLLVLFGVNGPLLAARLLLWQQLQLPVSTFLVKNVAVCLLLLYSIYENSHHKRLQAGLHEAQEMVS